MAPGLVVCMKWGSRYGAEYANKLYKSCRTHVSGDLQFVCFTDDRRGLVGDIDARPLPAFEGIPRELASLPWRKLSLWQRELGDLVGRDALVLDLDIVVTGSLDDFWRHAPGKYVVIENWTKAGRGIGNTSVFRLKLGSRPAIYEAFTADPAGIWRRYRIEQEYISLTIAAGEQAFWPKPWCRSFKEELLPPWPLRLWKDVPLPPDMRIAVFHGKPDPHEAMQGIWPEPQAWKRLYKRVRPVPWIAEHWGEL
jgi:hypothetical protein